MKLLIISFTLFSIQSFALEMEPGLWEYETELTGNPKMKMMMEQLKKMPPAQRDMVKKMMEQKMGGSVGFSDKGTLTSKCLTKEDISKMEQLLKKDILKDGCNFKVSVSTKNTLKGKLNCEDKRKNIEISLVMNSKKSGVNLTTSAMAEKPIKTKMKWVKGSCKKGKRDNLE